MIRTQTIKGFYNKFLKWNDVQASSMLSELIGDHPAIAVSHHREINERWVEVSDVYGQTLLDLIEQKTPGYAEILYLYECFLARLPSELVARYGDKVEINEYPFNADFEATFLKGGKKGYISLKKNNVVVESNSFKLWIIDPK